MGGCTSNPKDGTPNMVQHCGHQKRKFTGMVPPAFFFEPPEPEDSSPMRTTSRGRNQRRKFTSTMQTAYISPLPGKEVSSPMRTNSRTAPPSVSIEDEEESCPPPLSARSGRKHGAFGISQGDWVCAKLSENFKEGQRGRVLKIGKNGACQVQFEGHFTPVEVQLSSVRALPESLSTDGYFLPAPSRFALPHVK
mmetsp:Transcript_53290/g.84737  ORF Transcript_53290/g.84737 Transcript_53290/m.84737 type:complete len:194 (-) Transcript_53290:37-618(-)